MTNILLVLSDQHRADFLGFRNQVPVKTPHIDALAARGISWNRALTPAPLCGPARAALFTGLYPHQAWGELLPDPLGARPQEPVGVPRDMLINDSVLRSPPVLTRRLRDAGYHSAYAGKWHLGNEILPDWFDVSFGFDNRQYLDWLETRGLSLEGWPLGDTDLRTPRQPRMSIPRVKKNPLREEDTNDAWITDLALEMLRNRPREKPFFLVCGLNGPHPPFKVPEPYLSLYNPKDFPQPTNFHPSQGEPQGKKNSFYRKLWEDHGTRWEAWSSSAAAYAGFCSQIDHQVGRLTAALRDENILDDTLIIYASDHGEMLGQHGLWHKMQPYEESLRVPLVLAGPGVPSVGPMDLTASLLDIPRTILAAAEGAAAGSGQGQDLREPRERGEYWFSEQEPLGAFHGEAAWRMVCSKRWKFVWNQGEGGEFYDLLTDPGEQRNRFQDPSVKGVRAKLQKILLDWMKESEDKRYQEAFREGEAWPDL